MLENLKLVYLDQAVYIYDEDATMTTLYDSLIPFMHVLQGRLLLAH